MNRPTFSAAADRSTLLALTLAAALVCGAFPSMAQPSRTPQSAARGDYIVAVVGQDLVTAVEVDRRVAMVRQEAAAAGRSAETDKELRERALEALIDERIVLVYARESGARVEESELDRAVLSVAAQNKLTLAQLREQLKKEGLDYSRFRGQIRDQLLVERVREREVVSRIKVDEVELDDYLAKQAAPNRAREIEVNVAQILVSLPDGADDATVAQRRARAEGALARVRRNEDFATVARELSDDSNRAGGGEIGLRALSRLPDAFADSARKLRAGEVAPELLRTPAGFHVLKVIERRDAQDASVSHTRSRHILVRPTSQAAVDTVQRQLREFKRQIESGARRFEDLAREHSQDASAEQGGDLGFAPPGSYVPEFEGAMNALRPGQVSDPVETRFGFHLLQVVERKDVLVTAKQLREQARNTMREQRFGQAFNDWLQDLKSRAYVERRDPPSS